jgi:hypothetical protein
MLKDQTPLVVPELWLDWYFDASQAPFDGATTDAMVKEKQKKIEDYASSELSKEQPTWSLEFEWSIADTIPLVYNLKGTITKPTLKTAALVAASGSGIGTPQPPPQPPPPNL